MAMAATAARATAAITNQMRELIHILPQGTLSWRSDRKDPDLRNLVNGITRLASSLRAVPFGGDHDAHLAESRRLNRIPVRLHWARALPVAEEVNHPSAC